MATISRYDEVISLPRAIRFPVEMVPPPGFDPDRLETWPTVVGRLEYFDGRLLFMPPCGDFQQDTVTDVVITLGAWIRRHPEFVLGTNEAGMRLGGATRAADAAIWRRSDLGAYDGGLRRVPPILAVEVAGVDDGDLEDALREKAKWYLSMGAFVVWILFPERREVLVMSSKKEARFSADETIAAHPALPGLRPKASELFVQVGSRRA
ncbi:MAG TPA: Uma2 family endonuclease [Vicinamibacteria bacterium]|nr:Uma2 family endonuclease [Vicinamibacteria bacterium]